MTDAFEALRRPDAPIAPDDAFAKQLRQQLRRTLQPLLTSPPQEVTAMTVTPYLIVNDAAAALDFYRDAFGAVETHRLVGDDGRVGHSEFRLGNSTIMMADEYPEIDALGPVSRGGPTCSFSIEVDDVDAAFARAVSVGAITLREPADQFHGSRSATVQDPFGHRWTVTKVIETLTTAEYAERAANSAHGAFSLEAPTAGTTTADGSAGHQLKHHDQGDLYYFVLTVDDLARAQRFYGAVLGWQFSDPASGHAENISAPPGAVAEPRKDGGARLWFVVDDIHAAVQRVRELGGQAEDPVEYPSGWSADCFDDQGTMFSLSVPAYTQA